MAMVGLLDAFRLSADRPDFRSRAESRLPGQRQSSCSSCPAPTTRFILQQLVPSHFHNPWTVVAFALVAATVLKGIFDYVGTYLVNYAGFGMITDLRDDLYNTILRRSSGVFLQAHHRHADLDHRQRH